MRLADVRLLVDDYAGVVRFYTEVMGLEVRLRVPSVDPFYAELEAGSVVLSIYRRDLMAEAARGALRSGGGDASVIVFDVEGLDEAYRRLADQGVTTVTEPHDQATWGLRVAHLRDPDGNLIELDEPLPGSG